MVVIEGSLLNFVVVLLQQNRNIYKQLILNILYENRIITKFGFNKE